MIKFTLIFLNVNLFQIPRVDDPNKIIERIKEFADEYKKK